jgi:hypothetical protein
MMLGADGKPAVCDHVWISYLTGRYDGSANGEGTGRFSRYMVEHVKRVLADPKRVCTAYDPAAGYEIAGFVCLQGFNDLELEDIIETFEMREKPRV